MTIEIVDFPIENGDFPCFLYVYQRVSPLDFVWVFFNKSNGQVMPIFDDLARQKIPMK